MVDTGASLPSSIDSIVVGFVFAFVTPFFRPTAPLLTVISDDVLLFLF